MMKQTPIPFQPPLVRAILEGRKTQTRRPVKFEYASDVDAWALVDGRWRMGVAGDGGLMADMGSISCPYGQPGDRLWVRETWGLHAHTDATDFNRKSIVGIARDAALEQWQIAYRASWGPNDEACYWRPSILMPRWASRIDLEVTGVRVERLWDITEADAKAEGVEPCSDPTKPAEFRYTRGFSEAWTAAYGRESTSKNPWVWVIEFKQVQP